MPNKPLRPCVTPGCPEAAEPGASRCSGHQKAKWSQDTKASLARPELRESKQFYDSRMWRGFREQVLRREPWCRACRTAVATMVDHIRPIRQGGERLSLENVQPMCGACHAVKRAAESRSSL